MDPASKDILIIGGANGAGKTTAARVLLRDYYNLHALLNADEIARQISPQHPEAVSWAAGRVLIERMLRLVETEESFAFETTCVGKTNLKLLERCRQNGWRISLFYLWLPSPEMAEARVARRVREGGHNIPVEVTHRRYFAGIRNMRDLYLPLADTAAIYDNSDQRRILIAEKESGLQLRVHDAGRWSRIEELT